MPTPDLFPLIEKLATKSNTQLSIITEALAGAWERLEQGRADIVVAPDMHFRSSSEINSRKLSFGAQCVRRGAGSPDPSGAGAAL